MTAQAAERYLTPSEIVARYLDTRPVDVDALAQALGLVVRRDPSLSEDISGQITRAWDGSHFVIAVNARHSPQRQRFTLAHEIGHFVLHRDLIGDGLTDDALYRGRLSTGEAFSQYRESEANRYAADLLMPARAMRECWRAGMRSYSEFAQAFGVSTEAARIRLKALGYAP